jgi:hypothetical protein
MKTTHKLRGQKWTLVLVLFLTSYFVLLGLWWWVRAEWSNELVGG